MADTNKKQIEPDGVRLGEAIRRAREALGLSLRQLAPLVQLHHWTNETCSRWLGWTLPKGCLPSLPTCAPSTT